MLRDRFREWGLESKYNRGSEHKRLQHRPETKAITNRPSYKTRMHGSPADQLPDPYTLQFPEPNYDWTVAIRTANGAEYGKSNDQLFDVSEVAPFDEQGLVSWYSEQTLAKSLDPISRQELILPSTSQGLHLSENESSDDEPPSTPLLFSRLAANEIPCIPLEAGHTAFKLSRTPNIAKEDLPIRITVKAASNFYNLLLEERSAQRDALQPGPALEVQSLAANAKLAIAAQAYDSRAIWKELSELQHSVTKVMPALSGRVFHPRVLTALLRLLVDGVSVPGAVSGFARSAEESKTLAVVKLMFLKVARQYLGDRHPVTLLCAAPVSGTQSIELLRSLVELMARFYNHLNDTDPSFVAWEQIYTARVLSSLGYAPEGIVHLEAVMARLETHGDLCIKADAYRSMGYALWMNGSGDDAVPYLFDAYNLFKDMGYGDSENAKYTCICLASVFRQKGEIQKCEQYLSEAVAIWNSNRSRDGDKGGVKLVRDLNQVLCEQGKTIESQRLRQLHPDFFKESELWDSGVK